MSEISTSSGFRFWEDVFVRSAGFAAADIDCLEDRELRETWARWFRANLRARELASRVVREARRVNSTTPETKLPKSLFRQLERLETPRPEPDLPGVPEYLHAVEQFRAIDAEILSSWGPAQERTSRALFEKVTTDPRFQEAVLLQNPVLYERYIRRDATERQWERSPEGLDKKTRRRLKERRALYAAYLQRLCLKNDTISFFGPVGWGRATASEPSSFAPGPSWLDRRKLFLEHWAANAIASTLGSDVWFDQQPRAHPGLAIRNGRLVQGNRAVELPAEHEAVLIQLLNGFDGTAKELSRWLQANESDLFEDAEEALETIEALMEANLLTCRIEIPTLSLDFGRTMFSKIPDSARAKRVEKAWQIFASNQGSVAERSAAIAEFNRSFTEWTGTNARRKGGEFYIGRQPFYEDALRSGELVLGGMVAQSLGRDLDPVLATCRYFTSELARRYHRAFRDRFHSLARHGVLPFTEFSDAASDLLGATGGTTAISRDVLEKLRAHWVDALDLDRAGPSIRTDASALSERLPAELWDARPGWPMARYHAPDILVAAPSLEAFVGDACLPVLGEIHVAANTLFAQCALEARPDPLTLFDRAERDRLADGVFHMPSRANAIRAQTWPVRRNGWLLEGDGPARMDLGEHGLAGRPLRPGDLEVYEACGQLRVRNPKANLDLHLLQALDWNMSSQAVSSFGLFSKRRYVPRVQIGSVVVQRRTWRFGRDELPSLPKEPSRGPLELCRFFGRTGLPERGFAKTDTEPKPVFYDLAAPLLMENLLASLKSSSELVVSELLPGPSEAWYPGPGGAVTSEFRMVAVDPREWTEPAD